MTAASRPPCGPATSAGLLRTPQRAAPPPRASARHPPGRRRASAGSALGASGGGEKWPSRLEAEDDGRTSPAQRAQVLVAHEQFVGLWQSGVSEGGSLRDQARTTHECAELPPQVRLVLVVNLWQRAGAEPLHSAGRPRRAAHLLQALQCALVLAQQLAVARHQPRVLQRHQPHSAAAQRCHARAGGWQRRPRTSLRRMSFCMRSCVASAVSDDGSVSVAYGRTASARLARRTRARCCAPRRDVAWRLAPHGPRPRQLQRARMDEQHARSSANAARACAHASGAGQLLPRAARFAGARSQPQPPLRPAAHLTLTGPGRRCASAASSAAVGQRWRAAKAWLRACLAIGGSASAPSGGSVLARSAPARSPASARSAERR
jgi:hypothetical protein